MFRGLLNKSAYFYKFQRFRIFSQKTVFDKIISKEIPADIVYEDDYV